MASVSRSDDAGGGGPGGKILRRRRAAAPRTPYDRPSQLPHNSAPPNPNWLSKLILSPTRMIAAGAGKVLSVFHPESSSSSSDDESNSEDDSDDDNDDTDASNRDPHQLEKSESLGKDPGAVVWKSETKHAIEHLLMQETFSREECARLTHIIKSRVVDPPLTGSLNGRLSDIRNRTSIGDVDLPDLCSAALTEAKRWLEVKKLGSNTCTLNSAVSPHITEGEIQSPVDLAKLYMREHSPWSSPSTKDTQLISPSLMGTQLFQEDTPYLYSSHSVSASKLIRDSPSAGSWNISEEIRKVRSKATEDMLRTRPLSTTDVSTLAFDNKKSPGSFVADKAKPESVSQIAQDRLLNQASPCDPAASNSEKNQDLVTVRITEEGEALRDFSVGGLSHRERLQPSEDMNVQSQSGNNTAVDGPNDAGQPLNPTLGEDPRDSRSHEINDSKLVEVTIVDGEVATNGFPSSRSSLKAGQNGEEKSKLSSEPNGPVNPGHDINTIAPIDESREPLSESVIEVPIVDENDIQVESSQYNSSARHEEVTEAKSPSKRKASKVSDTAVTEKQQGERQRYARKAKGRLK